MSLKSILDSFESDVGVFSIIAVGDAIQDAAKNGALADDQQAAVRAEIMATLFAELPGNEQSSWETHFGPRAAFSNERGERVEFPSLKDVTDETLAHWQVRAREARHAVFRARYADLVWDLTAATTGRRPDHLYARLAIDAILELPTMPVPDDHPGIVQRKLARSLSLALALNDRVRVEKVRDAIVAYEHAHGVDGRIGTWGSAFDLLLENRKVPVPEDVARQIIATIEERLARTSSIGSATFDPWAAEAAARRLAVYYRKGGRKEDVARVLRLYASAFRHLAKQSPLPGTAWLRQVHDTLIKFELHTDAESLQPSIAAADEGSLKDMKTICSRMEITGDERRKTIDSLIRKTLAETLDHLAAAFIVDKSRAEKELKLSAEATPLQSLFGQHRLDSMGRTEAVVGSIADDLDGQVVVHMTSMMSMNALFLRWGLDEAWTRFTPSVDDLCSYVFQAPIFEEKHRPLVRRALEAYVANDYITFAHVIIPQIEQAIRRLVILAKGQHLAPGQRGEPPRLRLLHELLRDPIIEQVFGNRPKEHLIVLLVDDRGLNLRNGTTHGYVDADRFDGQMADMLFHALLLVSQVRTEKPVDAPPSS